MKKNIYNLLNLLQEGIEWKVNPDKTVNMAINNKQDDKNNLAGKFAVDNRRYSTKDIMLNGDRSYKRLSTIQDNYELNNTLYGDKGFYMTLYKLLQRYEKTGAIKLPNSMVSANIFDSALTKSKANACKNSYVISSIKAFKDKWYNRKIVFVDRFYPSSKTCHNCGYVNKSLTLKDRQWVCPHCGEVIERDYNAALNILDEGLRIIGAKL